DSKKKKGVVKKTDEEETENPELLKITWKVNVDQFVDRLETRMSKLIHGNLFVKGYPTRTVTTTMIRNHLNLLLSRDFVPDLIIVDYADIMKPERRLGEMRHEQAGIYEDLRQIAGEFNAAVWTASQAPKSALDKATLDLGDFAEAFEKAAIVDAAMAFCQTNEEKFKEECRLALIGLRYAEDGRMILCYLSRERCLLRSKQLLSPAQVPIPCECDRKQDEDPTTTLQTTTVTHSAVKKLSEKAGLHKPGVHKKGSKKKPTKKV
ncbi:hypothetical protein LCGC14_1760190, partial [marine sediment metagenome]